ncbi:hypothetical protein Tco_1264130 [Tanacetum coccineum]
MAEIGCNWARIGPSKSSQSLSNAHKWAVGRVPAERLIPDEVEAGSGWWLSSRAYFDGRVSEAERPLRHLNRQNHYEVPSEFYQDFQEQRSGLDQMMKQGQNIIEKMKKYMEDLNVGTGANREPIIVDQHYGISDLSGFQSIHGGPSSFQTPTNHSFFNMGTPINRQTPRPSQASSSNWQSQMPTYTPSPIWQPHIPSHPGDVGLCDPRPRREQRPSVYMQSPYTPLPPTTELPKKRVGITKKKCKNDNLSPLNLGNAFVYDNARGDGVVITGVHDTGIYFTYENVDPNKLCVGHVPIVPHESERYWENIRYEMGELFYKCRCENTRNCGYD